MAAVYGTKAIPWVLALVLVVTWGIGWKAASASVALEEFREEVPFATLADLFPQGELERTSMGDYNTVVHYSTALSDNYEWKEQADITDTSGNYYGILRLSYHDTAGEFWAKGLVSDYYSRERLRYRGKRFEDLEAPVTGFDEVRVFRSYGILHILIRQDNKVFHGVVTLSDREQGNHWQLWLAAMEKKLLPG